MKDIEIYLKSTLKKYLRDEKIENSKEKVCVKCAKNEYESTQIILKANRDVEYFDLILNDLKDDNGNVLKKENIELYFEKYIEIKKASGMEKEAGHDQPGWYPDALLPFKTAKTARENNIKSGFNQGIWVTFNIPENVCGGLYKGNFTLYVDGELEDIPVEITIYNFSLPREIKYHSDFVVGLHGLSKGEGDHYPETYRSYVRTLLKYKLAPHMLYPTGAYKYLSMDDEWLPELEYYLSDDMPYLSTIMIPCFPYFKGGFDEDNFKDYVRTIYKCSLKRNENLFERTAVYCGFIDEPHLNKTWDYANFVCERFEITKNEVADEIYGSSKKDDFAKAICESIKNIGNFVTSSYDEKLDKVKSWCFHASYFQTKEKRDVFKNEKRKWWYTCNSGAEFFHYNIDHQAMDVRMEGIMRHKYDVDGTLYWETVNYSGGTWCQPEHLSMEHDIDCYKDAERGGTDYGDGFLFYPGKPYGLKEPVTSIRLHLIRDAAEDYEYVRLLKDLYSKAGKNADVFLDKIYDKLFTDLKVNVNEDEFYMERDLIAKYIENALNGKFEN